MLVSRLARLTAAASLVLAGTVPAALAGSPALAAGTAEGLTALQVEAASAGPVQVLELTTPAGEATELAEAGLGEQRDTRVPAGTSGGTGVIPRLDVALADALAALTGTIDPEADAALLTEPLEVAGFLVAGFTWAGSVALPEGTQIYLRVRENGVWTDWYLNEPADAGRDDLDPTTATSGTDEFVTGGADAIQAAVIAGPAGLPEGLSLSLVPGEPIGEEVLEPEDMKVVEADKTGVAEEEEPPTFSATPSPSAQPGDGTSTATFPSEPGPMQSSGPSQSPAGTSTGTGMSPALPALLATATTANGLPVPVITRAEWGANAAYLDWDPEYVTAGHVVVHHTAGTNDYTAAQAPGIVRGIYYYHANTLGWGDIGYNFLVDKYGNVYEGRYGTLSSAAGKMVIGGHAYGANTGTMGISMMGTFTSVSPSTAQLQSVGRLSGWFLARAGITSATASAPFTIRSTEKYQAGQVITLPRIFAHRDVGYTACPGDVGYSLMGTIRSIAQDQVTAASANWQSYGSTWRLVTADGRVLTGWHLVAGTWYYLGDDGLMRTGWQAAGVHWYLLDSSGAMLTGWQKVEGSWYYLGDDGAMATGWQKAGGSWYLLDSSGAMLTGWQKVEGSWYYLGDDGAMDTGWLTDNGYWYHLASTGAMDTGWLSQGSTWYYLGGDGAMRTGWATVNGARYYLGTDGAMLAGWQKMDGTWYHLASTGATDTGWLSQGSTWYYLGGDGVMATGWQKVDGTWYHFASTGAMDTGWLKDDGTWYHLASTGAMDTGWLSQGSTWYYLRSDGVMATGTVDTGGSWHAFSSSGAWLGRTSAPTTTPTSSLTPVMAAPRAARSTVINTLVTTYQGSGRTYPAAELGRGGASSLWSFCAIVYDEAVAEGVSPELLFAQVMTETGWLQFGGDVAITQYNFGGIGATGNGNPGLSFANVRTGLRAQVQHLRAYADASVTVSDLAHPLADPRFTYVRKGSAPYVEYLGIQENPAGTGWAAAAGYGHTLVALMKTLG
ncbi:MULTISPECIES: N-acetylmuramoyl-L-alanine amidase [Actinomyces]|uniref:N-acetylmuramoyl-L-alanine amidase n=1 Tax=Actinomyces respiraculi TaxID=2744574 RepID=A0A7T0LLV3_9ACTO|nr:MULTISPECIES: N-acetylmuramoyl-L-alanine amidase [Actinomyces]QPL05816.1 N-acetylmuramoyl-L-alanine amidase [Actinomyces respiraculi]